MAAHLCHPYISIEKYAEHANDYDFTNSTVATLALHSTARGFRKQRRQGVQRIGLH